MYNWTKLRGMEGVWRYTSVNRLYKSPNVMLILELFGILATLGVRR